MLEKGTNFARIAQEVGGVLFPERITSMQAPEMPSPILEGSEVMGKVPPGGIRRIRESVRQVVDTIFPPPLKLMPETGGIEVSGTVFRGEVRPNSLQGLEGPWLMKKRASGKPKGRGKDGGDESSDVPDLPLEGGVVSPKKNWVLVGPKVFHIGDMTLRIPIFAVVTKDGLDENPPKGPGKHSLPNDRAGRLEEAARERKRVLNIRKKRKRKI